LVAPYGADHVRSLSFPSIVISSAPLLASYQAPVRAQLADCRSSRPLARLSVLLPDDPPRWNPRNCLVVVGLFLLTYRGKRVILVGDYDCNPLFSKNVSTAWLISSFRGN
jgi:hypothetical protein